MLLRKEFIFDAAHNLVRYHGKCEALHGHTYRLAVVLEGTPDDEGMILDFCELSSIVKERVVWRKHRCRLDRRCRCRGGAG